MDPGTLLGQQWPLPVAATCIETQALRWGARGESTPCEKGQAPDAWRFAFQIVDGSERAEKLRTETIVSTTVTDAMPLDEIVQNVLRACAVDLIDGFHEARVALRAFAKYVRRVGEAEGVFFVDPEARDERFTPDEWEILRRAVALTTALDEDPPPASIGSTP